MNDVGVICYIRFAGSESIATIMGSSIDKDPLFEDFVIIRDVQGVSESSRPYFQPKNLRIRIARVEYIIDGKDEIEQYKEKIRSSSKIEEDTVNENSSVQITSDQIKVDRFEDIQFP